MRRPISKVGLALLALSSFLSCTGSDALVDTSTEREIEQGRIIGSTLRNGRVHAWRGIPFAAAPVGPLRWRAPQPPEAWSETRVALESGSMCAQLGGEPIQGSEDCLYLDVFAPAATVGNPPNEAPRPVLYWIHGGGNSMGSGDMIDVSRLAAEHDVVVVTINYRLGVFGWFSHPALRAALDDPDELSDDASGNFGTLDMIRGLEWVRANIAAFGGDPDRVILMGESAGGVDVFSLLLSPRAAGLFRGAIAQSGSPMSMTRIQAEHYTDDEEPGLPGSSAELVSALLRQAGLAMDRVEAKKVAASMTPEAVDAFLREQSTEEILGPFAESAEGSVFPMYMAPNVIRDGEVIPTAPPLEVFATAGGYNAVPFIAGTNREEHKLFFAMTSPHVTRRFGIPTGFENLRRYDIEGEYGGLMWRATGVDEPLSRMQAVQGPSVWSYRFDWDEEPSILGLDVSRLIGAGHAVEMLFVFGLTDLGFANRLLYDDPRSAEALSVQMRSYWAAFAHSLDPGRGQQGELLEWPAWDPRFGEPKYLIFDSARDGGLRIGRDEIDRDFVLDRAMKDPRLLDIEERCSVLRNFVQWSDALTEDDYDAVMDGACQAHPMASRLFLPSLEHANDTE